MGVEIKLSDRDLPVSPVFIDFLHRHIEGRDFEPRWHDQLTETLVPANFEQTLNAAVAASDAVLADPVGQRAIFRSYELLTALMLGQLEKLRTIHERFRFLCVVGCPRHGGTYLTKAFFHALGFDPVRVPNVIAHDGFPDAAPFKLAARYNAHTALMQQMAEYLAMVEVFFGEANAREGAICVPKKASKAAYDGAFFNAALGPGTEYLITLRHPLAACVSTYEKSSGLPEDGRFAVRGNIEEWAGRDTAFNVPGQAVSDARDYVDVYVRYWEQYHCRLALTGLFGHPHARLVVYGRDRMMQLAKEIYARFGRTDDVEPFQVVDTRTRHPEWQRRCDDAVRRVGEVWRSVGLEFPTDEVMEGW